MKHLAASLFSFSIALSFYSVHCFIIPSEGNELQCKEVSRETRINVLCFVQLWQSDITGVCTLWDCFLTFRDDRAIGELRCE